jgi:hypothetical protein
LANKRAEASIGYQIVLGVLCVVASLSAGAIYLFDFGPDPLSVKSFFWAAPIISPVALVVYLRSRIGGACIQAALYALAVLGAYKMFQADYLIESCTQNRLVTALGSLFAGVHIICMLAGLIVACMGVRETIRLQRGG